MRAEIALVRDSVTVDVEARTEPSRKALRVVTDKLIHDALLIDDLPTLVTLSSETMCTVAEVLVQYGQDPDVLDLVDGTRALIECGRAVMDRGLMLKDWATTRSGAVMLELSVRGLCAALSVPYDLVLAEVHRANLAGENPIVRPILLAAGLLKRTDEDPPAPAPCDHVIGTHSDGCEQDASKVAEYRSYLSAIRVQHNPNHPIPSSAELSDDDFLLSLGFEFFKHCHKCGALLRPEQ